MKLPEEVKRALPSGPGVARGGGATEEEIREAETQLGSRLPESYRLFASEFGWCQVPGVEIYGLGAGVPDHLNLVRNTQVERTVMEPRLPVSLVPIMNDGGGNHYCLDVQALSEHECPVVLWNHELGNRQTPEFLAPNFAEWLRGELDARA